MRRSTLFRSAILSLALVVPLVLVLPSAAAEGPTEGRCDSTSLMVCALAGSGANASCAAIGPAGVVSSCTVTFGWGWQGFSRAGVPGHVEGSAAVEHLFCRGMGGCTLAVTSTEQADPFACSWIGPVTCDGSGAGSATSGPFTLALGECLRVGARVATTSTASAAVGGQTLASASWTEPSEGGTAICNDGDNGRD